MLETLTTFIEAQATTPWVLLLVLLVAAADALVPPVPSESVVVALAAVSVSADGPNLAPARAGGRDRGLPRRHRDLPRGPAPRRGPALRGPPAPRSAAPWAAPPTPWRAGGRSSSSWRATCRSAGSRSTSPPARRATHDGASSASPRWRPSRGRRGRSASAPSPGAGSPTTPCSAPPRESPWRSCSAWPPTTSPGASSAGRARPSRGLAQRIGSGRPRDWRRTPTRRRRPRPRAGGIRLRRRAAGALGRAPRVRRLRPAPGRLHSPPESANNGVSTLPVRVTILTGPVRVWCPGDVSRRHPVRPSRAPPGLHLRFAWEEPPEWPRSSLSMKRLAAVSSGA